MAEFKEGVDPSVEGVGAGSEWVRREGGPVICIVEVRPGCEVA